MLLLDGVKYLLQTPTDEESLEATVREHAKEIFGETTVCFDLKHKLTSKTGIGSIPDAYVVDFSDPPRWYIVEVELASHPVDEHIMPQLNRFMRGIRNADSQKEVSDAIHSEIDENKMLRTRVETKIGSKEIHRFLSDLISIPPEIIVVIDERTEKLAEALEAFKYELEIIELKTFVRENAEKVHIHIFEPIHALKRLSERTGKKESGTRARTGEITSQADYTRPILESLIEMGGSGRMFSVLGMVLQKMKDKLTSKDLEKLPTGPGVRWKNKAQWERQRLKTEGYLKKDSPRGIWEITDEGRRYCESLAHEQ